ncbi:thiol-disulfide oxidoreductase DCC family protein [Rubrimonas sp.]|uniref:thiol-disulfide oxidoreductase DCC family protein n=1 Tax=Rubrimonas sp. TaxID=2036015 RepID=UPI002FDD7922
MDEPASPDPAAAREVFYDGGCPLCRAEISAYRRMQGAERIAFRDASAGEAPPEITPARALARFHVRRMDGRLVSGFRAFLAVWRVSPRLAPLARALDRAPFRWIGEAAYRLFLPMRRLWRGTPR